MKAWLDRLPFRRAIWLAPLAWALHEAEEWNIHEFERKHFVDPGYFDQIDQPILWIGLAWVSFLGLAWTALTAWPNNPKFAAFLTLPFFFYICLGNALQHLWWTYSFGAYAPGVLTSVLLLIPVISYLALRAFREKLIPGWYVVVLAALTIQPLVSVVRAGNQMTPEFQARHQNGIRIAKVILGR